MSVRQDPGEAPLDRMEWQFRYQQAVRWLNEAKAGEGAGKPAAREGISFTGIGSTAELKGPSAGSPAPASGPAMTPEATALSRGGSNPGGGGHAPGKGGRLSIDNATRVTIAAMLIHVESEDESPQTKAILKKLDEPVAMSFADETPLEDVLKYLKSALAGPNDSGIPIYVDPVGLQEAAATLNSPVSMDLEGVPVKTSLRLLLKQVGLAYCVKEGVLIISSVEGIRQELTEYVSAHPDPEDPDRFLRGNIGVGGGFGGMGGGMR